MLNQKRQFFSFEDDVKEYDPSSNSPPKLTRQFLDSVSDVFHGLRLSVILIVASIYLCPWGFTGRILTIFPPQLWCCSSFWNWVSVCNFKVPHFIVIILNMAKASAVKSLRLEIQDLKFPLSLSSSFIYLHYKGRHFVFSLSVKRGVLTMTLE